MTGDGQYRYYPGVRCKAEKRGEKAHPLGEKGDPWTLALCRHFFQEKL